MSKKVTIEISEESLDFIRGLAETMHTQDNRITASPYYFTIREPKRIYGMDYRYTDSYEYEWIHEDDGENCESDQFWNMIERNHPKHNIIGKDEDEIAKELGYEKIYYKTIHIYHNIFLTEQAIKRHIKQNHHRYHKDVDTYVEHAFRNPELEKVFKVIKEIAGIGDKKPNET